MLCNKALRTWLFRFMVLLIPLSLFAQDEKLPSVEVYFFYSEDCEDCQAVIKDVLSPLQEVYNLNIKSFEIGNVENYELLCKIEEKYDDYDNEIPIIVIGDYILGSASEIREKLETLVQEYMAKGGIEFPAIDIKEVVPVTEPVTANKVYIAYFYEIGCEKCDRATYELKCLENRYPNLVVKKFDLTRNENKRLNEALCKLYQVPDKKRLTSPIAFIGEEFLIEDEINRRRIAELIQKYQTGENEIIPWERAKELDKIAEKSIVDRFKAMSVFTVISAGLIDGVNPCAFATIILFISFLSFVGKKGKSLLLVGITFTSTVFITYFLIGIGLLHFVRKLEFMPILGKVVYSLTAVLAIVFGILSAHDYIKYRQEKYAEAKLKLPAFLKRRVDSIIREKVEMKSYIFSAVVTGFLISILEFACTGQVYLPTIIFVSKVPSLRVKGLAYLFLYNLAFIIPLAIVFAAAYRGTTSLKLGILWKRHAKSIKLVTSILFFLLAGLLIFYVYY